MTAATTESSTEIIPFTAGDGMALNMPGARADEPWRGPVILVHGAGVGLTSSARRSRNVVNALVADGWDVWLENWRASIDVTPNPWDLDQAAVFDHPAAVRHIIAATGAKSLKALIHCQGSSSFAYSAVSGLLPEVDTIVSNAMSLHPIVPWWSRVKLRLRRASGLGCHGWVDPHCGASRPGRLPRTGDGENRPSPHRECDNTVCKMVSFTTVPGGPDCGDTNFSAQTHAWLTEEFGPVPLTFFKQIAKSARLGKLMPTGTVPPAS